MGLVTAIYNHTKSLPEEERYGLIVQLRKSSVSLPSNMAEGYGRNSTQDYIRYWKIANRHYLNFGLNWKLQRNLNNCHVKIFLYFII